MNRKRNMSRGYGKIFCGGHARPTKLVALSIVLLLVGAARATAVEQDDLRVTETALQSIFAGGVPTSVEDLKAMESHQQQLANSLQRSTVAVQVGVVHGSGVIISESGYLLTAAHVASHRDQEAIITFFDGAKVRGTTLGLNRNRDAGLIKVNASETVEAARHWGVAKMGRSESVEVGQWLMSLGHPGGFQADRGAVVRVGRVLENQDEYIQTDCKLVGGDSGGPLFDMNGCVVGIHSRIGNSLANNLHVPVDSFLNTWERLVDGNVWGNLPGVSPFIGIRGDAQAEDAIVVQVFPGTPAADAGIKVGDVVVRFGSHRISDFDSLKQLVEKTHPGDEVTVRLRRNQALIDLGVIIGDLGS